MHVHKVVNQSERVTEFMGWTRRITALDGKVTSKQPAASATQKLTPR